MGGRVTLFSLINFVIVASVIYLLNIPFGYWRKNVPKKSLQWVLAIHIPVPFIFLFRTLMGFGLETIPLFAVFFFLGQLTGGKLLNRLTSSIEVSSCLVMDIVKLTRSKYIEE